MTTNTPTTTYATTMFTPQTSISTTTKSTTVSTLKTQVSNITVTAKFKQVMTRPTMTIEMGMSTRINVRESVSIPLSNITIPQEFVREFQLWTYFGWILPNEDVNIDQVNWQEVARIQLPRTGHAECAKSLEAHRQVILNILNDWQTGRERGRLNSPNLLKLYNMDEGLCYRQLRIRLRNIRRALRNFLSKEMTRLARGESRSK